MKEYKGEYYDAVALDGGCRLMLNHNETPEAVKTCIDESNQRAMKKGYKAERWIITHVKWSTCYSDDGIFVEAKRTENAFAVYPAILEGSAK